MSLRMWFLVVTLVIVGFCALDAVHAQDVKPASKVHKKVTSKKTSKAKTQKKSAKTVSKKAVKKVLATSPKATSGELTTDAKFDDSVLHGQYQTPEEALARVENEKGLSDLLGVRKHFKDRLATASEQE